MKFKYFKCFKNVLSTTIDVTLTIRNIWITIKKLIFCTKDLLFLMSIRCRLSLSFTAVQRFKKSIQVHLKCWSIANIEPLYFTSIELHEFLSVGFHSRGCIFNFQKSLVRAILLSRTFKTSSLFQSKLWVLPVFCVW